MSFDREEFADEYPFASHWLERPGAGVRAASVALAGTEARPTLAGTEARTTDHGIEVRSTHTLPEFRASHRLHYLDEGQGDPVIMVHGNPTWSFYYRNLILALRPTHRCIVPDHIGCGLSDKPGDDTYEYTLAARVADLEALLDHLGLVSDLTFVVHDWGGMIGLTVALRRLQQVSRIVILNTAAFLMPKTKRLPFLLRLGRNGGWVADLLIRRCNAFAYGAAWMASKRGLSRRLRRAYCAPYDSPQNRIATLRFVQDIPLSPGDRSYELAKWTDDHIGQLRQVPVLFGWGRRDFVFDDHYLAEWRRRLPHAQTHVFEYAGHYVLEDAATELIPLVQEFLSVGAQADNGEASDMAGATAARAASGA